MIVIYRYLSLFIIYSIFSTRKRKRIEPCQNFHGLWRITTNHRYLSSFITIYRYLLSIIRKQCYIWVFFIVYYLFSLFSSKNGNKTLFIFENRKRKGAFLSLLFRRKMRKNSNYYHYC